MLDEVLRSADRARLAGLVDADMAILVQPMLQAAWAACCSVPTRCPAASTASSSPLSPADRTDWCPVRSTAGLACWTGAVAFVRFVPPMRRALLCRSSASSLDSHAGPRHTYGGPQDIEWAVDRATARCTCCRHARSRRCRRHPARCSGRARWPSRSRPAVDVGAGPLARPVARRSRHALALTGTSPAGALRRSPVVIAVDGMAAADLAVLGVDVGRRGLLRRFDPRPPARRLRAAWRVGRLRSALPELAVDLVERIDGDLAAVPALDGLGNHELLALLATASAELVSLHGHEALRRSAHPGPP